MSNLEKKIFDILVGNGITTDKELIASKAYTEIQEAISEEVSKARAEGLPSKSEDEAVNAFFHEPALNEQSKKWSYGILGYEALEQAAINLFRAARNSALAEISKLKDEKQKLINTLERLSDDTFIRLDIEGKAEFQAWVKDKLLYEKKLAEHQEQVRLLKDVLKKQYNWDDYSIQTMDNIFPECASPKPTESGGDVCKHCGKPKGEHMNVIAVVGITYYCSKNTDNWDEFEPQKTGQEKEG